MLDGLVIAELAGADVIAIERLRRTAPALRRLVVIRLAEDAAGTFVPQAGERVEEILALAQRGNRAELHVGGLVSAVIENGELRMVRIEPREQHHPTARVAPSPSLRRHGLRSRRGAGRRRGSPRRVRDLGEAISRDYAGKRLLLVWVLKGAVFFLSDLMRHIDIPVEVDFMAVASYGSATDSSGVVRILKDLDVAHRGPRCADRGGHRRLRAHVAIPTAQPRLAQPRLARGVLPAHQALPAQGGSADALRRL